LILREAFAEAQKVFSSLPELSFWAGKRYYRRHDVHINDFWILDMSGYGGGFLDLNLGIGKLAVAYLGGSTSKDLLGRRGHPAKHTVDVRLYDIPAPGGRLMLWLAGAYAPGGKLVELDGEPVEGERVPEVDGWGASVFYQIDDVLGGYNKLTLQYATGALTDFTSSYRPLSNYLTEENPGQQLVSDSWRVRFTDAIHMRPHKHFSMMAAGIYQLTETAASAEGAKIQWVSGGLRPILHLGPYASIAVEVGVDHVTDKLNDRTGYLAKYTIAPQVSSGDLWWSRPALRAYVTYAHWNDEFRGVVGGPAYERNTAGLGFGAQLEAWW
jgi:maltoporin